MFLNCGGSSMMDWNDMMVDWDHMMNWWGFPFMGFWMIGIWLIFIVVAFLVYKDAEKRGMNGLLWLLLVIIPWIGIFFLILYLILRNGPSHQVVVSKNAQQILDERYAKGEITKEEYEQKKNDLKSE
jgi:putative membrane protein